jgi:hypothetical protein
MNPPLLKKSYISQAGAGGSSTTSNKQGNLMVAELKYNKNLSKEIKETQCFSTEV